VRVLEPAPHHGPRLVVGACGSLDLLDILALGAAGDLAAVGQVFCAVAGGVAARVEQGREGAVGLGDAGRVPCAALGLAVRHGLFFFARPPRRHGLLLFAEPPRLEADAREERRDTPHRARRRLEGLIWSRCGVPHLRDGVRAVRVRAGTLYFEVWS